MALFVLLCIVLTSLIGTVGSTWWGVAGLVSCVLGIFSGLWDARTLTSQGNANHILAGSCLLSAVVAGYRSYGVDQPWYFVLCVAIGGGLLCLGVALIAGAYATTPARPNEAEIEVEEN